jgi:putative hydrolase of the HAD superfamily
MRSLPWLVAEITTFFWDLGGVVLTNGWDRVARRNCVESFDLDWEEFADRHDFVAHDFEVGRIDLEEYLLRTVFYRDRSFAPIDFMAAMKAESQPLPGSLDLVAEIAAAGYLMVTLNNESRELNEHRIETFGLRRHFSAFLSSCYLGVKKPEPVIYRLAFDITQRRPEECLFIDDRSLNLECARDQGLAGIPFRDADQLRNDLRNDWGIGA